ncbi:MAG: hypothetical protein V3R95_05780 [Dehalococcoidia bacterium]
MEVTFAMLARDYALDDRQRPVIKGVFNSAKFASFPVVNAAEFMLVFGMEAHAEEFGVEVAIRIVQVGPDGVAGGEMLGLATPGPGVPGVPSVIYEARPITATFPTPGAYEYRIHLDGDLKASVNLHVTQDAPKPA